MKAARLFGVGDLRVVDVPLPEPGEGEVLIKVMAVGVCGSDIPRVMVKGTYRVPLTIGHEFAGQLAAVGRGVSGWNAGDRVTVAPLIPCYACHWCRQGDYHMCDDYSYLGSRCDGALAEFVKAPARNLVRLPDNVDDEAGALSDPAATALHALWRYPFPLGGTLAVFGVGAIGFLALQWGRLMGAGQLVAVDVFDDKLQLASELGATCTVNARRQDPVAIVRGLGEAGGADLVIEAAALQVTQLQAIRSARKHGAAVLLGISNDRLELPPAVVDDIMRRELLVTGTWNSNSMPFPGREWSLSVEAMGRGQLQCRPLISHRYAIEDAPAVFSRLARRDFSFTKVMFNLA